jgi:hypothetical protein
MGVGSSDAADRNEAGFRALLRGRWIGCVGAQ